MATVGDPSAYHVYVSPAELFCSAVAEKVTVKQDREFEVASVEREAGCRIVSTQTPVSMEGNPSGIKIICVLHHYYYSYYQLQCRPIYV